MKNEQLPLFHAERLAKLEGFHEGVMVTMALATGTRLPHKRGRGPNKKPARSVGAIELITKKKKTA